MRNKCEGKGKAGAGFGGRGSNGMGAATTLKKRPSRGRRPFYKHHAFWHGFASAFNVWGNFYPLYHGRDPRQADYEALRGDWEAVGRDMEVVLRRFEREHVEELRSAEQQRLFDPEETERRR